MKEVWSILFSIKERKDVAWQCGWIVETQQLLSVADGANGGVPAALSPAFCHQNIKGTWKWEGSYHASCTLRAHLSQDGCDRQSLEHPLAVFLHTVPPFWWPWHEFPCVPGGKEGILTQVDTHVVLHQIRMCPLDAIIQDGDHYVLPRVAPLPGTFDIHVWLAGMHVVTAMLEKEEGELDTAGCWVRSRRENNLPIKTMLSINRNLMSCLLQWKQGYPAC